jgi:nucleoid DNA-binding protein
MARKKTVTKLDLVRMTARISGVRLDDADKICNALFATLRQYIMDSPAGAKIDIRDFGVFQIRNKGPYTAPVLNRLPKSGEKGEFVLETFHHRVVKFKPGILLRTSLRKILEAPEWEISKRGITAINPESTVRVYPEPKE